MKKILSLVIAFAMVAMTAMTAFADTATPYTIFGDDSREWVQITTSSPYSAICNLTITWSDKSKTYGTGFLISPTRVATAGHCLYNKSTGATATKIKVVPGETPSKQPYSYQEVTDTSKFHCSEKFKSEGNTTYDYGYIEPNSKFTGNPATLSLNSSLRESELKNTFTLLGYDIYSAKLYKTTGIIYEMTQRQLKHKMDTLSGMSGSPILDKNNKVVGINAYSIDSELPPGNKVDDDYPDYNKATLITTTVCNFLTEGME